MNVFVALHCYYSNPISFSPQPKTRPPTVCTPASSHVRLYVHVCVCVCVWNPFPCPLIRYQQPETTVDPHTLSNHLRNKASHGQKKSVHNSDATLRHKHPMHASTMIQVVVIRLHTRTSNTSSLHGHPSALRATLHTYVCSFL